MEGSRAKDFGKEIGLVHGGIVTLRNLGLTPEGWQKMAEDKELAKKVVELVEGQKEFWLEKILARERACHLAFFGQEFDLTDFAFKLKKYGESKIKFWQRLGMGPHFFPAVAMPQDAKFKGWKIKPGSWFYEKISEGKIFREVVGELVVVKEAALEGVTVLVDTRLKPIYNGGKQMYKNDNLLGPIVGQLREFEKIAKYDYGSQTSRFGISADEWEQAVKSALAGRLGLELRQLRLEHAIEANVIPQLYSYMPRKRDGETDTWVWYEEYFEGRDYRLGGGDSGSGGVADVGWVGAGDHWDDISVRPLAVL